MAAGLPTITCAPDIICRMTARFFALLFALIFLPAAAGAAEVPSKPIVSYLLGLPGAAESLDRAAGLSDRELSAVLAAGRGESAELAAVKSRSDGRLRSLKTRGPIDDVRLNRLYVAAEVVDFNSEVAHVESGAKAEIRRAVGDQKAELFDAWIESAWLEEATARMRSSEQAGALGLTRQVYATQYIAYSNYEVAVPDKYIKFANLDWEHAPGYEGNNYTVNLKYDGASVNSVKVLDVGPWNQDDNYWNKTGSAVRPRRKFTDLAWGMPEAQAAFLNDYNGGLDQFGRQVVNPAGIDLAPAVAADLGLGYLENAWIDVTYNWEALNFGGTKIASPGYSTKNSKTRTFKVSWSGSDASLTAGLASYQVQVRPAAASAWSEWQTATTASSADFMGNAGRTYYFRARARGTDNTLGHWSSPKRTIVPYDQDKLIFKRVGFNAVFRGANSGYYLGTSRYSTKRGTLVVYKFTGRHVALISTKGPTRSRAKIYMDGNYVKTVDNYAPKTRTRQPTFDHSWGAAGTHYLKVVNLATPGRERFDLDALAVGN